MFDNLMAGLALVANIDSVLALAGGVFVGVIAGAIPGLSATMAVALTLPFTFSMTPITGILLLLGVYKGGIFGGSIPAILITRHAGVQRDGARWPPDARERSGGQGAGNGIVGFLYR